MQAVTCPVCQGMIEQHWQVFAHASCQPLPSAQQLAWREEKALNRLQRKAERLYGLPWNEIWRRYGPSRDTTARGSSSRRSSARRVATSSDLPMALDLMGFGEADNSYKRQLGVPQARHDQEIPKLAYEIERHLRRITRSDFRQS
jgi:hypothetical protein